MAEEPPVVNETKPDPQDAAYQALHAEREQLERALRLTQQQQRFGADPQAVDEARGREESLLKDLDRVLTLIRAAEVRRKSGSVARRWK